MKKKIILVLLINIAVCSILQAQTRIAVLQFTDDKSGAVVTGVLCTVQRKYVRYYYPSENNHSKQDIQEEVTFEPDIGCCILGGSIGGTLMLSGIIITACCAYPFIIASRIASIYAKTTGNKLAFLERTNFDCCYNFDNKEFTLGMTIKI